MDILFTKMLIIRVLAAFLCGTAIGIERNTRGKHTGIRTHGFICVSTCVFILLSLYVSRSISEFVDITYLAEQIINGIAFLGIGVIIIRRNNHITGLHTACGFFATAAIGMACGCGKLVLAGATTVIIIFIQSVLHHLIISRSVFVTQDIHITTTDVAKVFNIIENAKREHNIKIRATEVKRDEDGAITVFIRVRTPKPLSSDVAIAYKDTHSEIKAITV